MKVNIGPYATWFGPYQIAEKILFWKDKRKINEDNPTEPHPDSDAIHNFGARLDSIPGLTRFCEWVYSKKKRKIKVHIDGYDTWSAYHTIALVVHPMMVSLKDNKVSASFTDDEDVPEAIRSTSAAPKENEWDTDEHFFTRWDYVLDEIIFALGEYAKNNWEDQFPTRDWDVPVSQEEKDRKATHHNRMKNGLRLFGKYYESLWS
jgi:hypothetical protein